MIVETIVKNVNKALANETLRYTDLEHLMDKVIDEINENLNSTYPSMSEFVSSGASMEGNYNLFPEKYIRSVLIPGVAFYFYQQDEEGEFVASSFSASYREGLFKMTRDFIMKVPEEFQADDEGYVRLASDIFGTTVGIDITNGCKI